jgi:hypothetical protein
MMTFFEEQDRIRRRPSPSSGLWRDRQGVFAEAYMSYVAGRNPRRTQLIGKRAISGLKLAKNFVEPLALKAGSAGMENIYDK